MTHETICFHGIHGPHGSASGNLPFEVVTATGVVTKYGRALGFTEARGDITSISIINYIIIFLIL
jgi:hypothetical protein